MDQHAKGRGPSPVTSRRLPAAERERAREHWTAEHRAAAQPRPLPRPRPARDEGGQGCEENSQQ